MPVAPIVDLQVRIEADLPPVVPEAISFETGASREQAADPKLYVYEHHGAGFGPADPGALTSFFEDLILGRAFPLTFATRSIQDIDTIVAATLFLQRDLAVHPDMPGFVAAVDLVHRRGFPALAHVEQDLARFLCFLQAYFPEKGLSKRELGERLGSACGWVREFVIDKRLPTLGKPLMPVQVLKEGTDGFVLAETHGALIDGWVQLYQRGFLRGLVVGPLSAQGRRSMLAARKSGYVSFDLSKAALFLNEVERAMGYLPEWESDGIWLRSPPEGSTILVSHMIDVLTRV